MPCPNDPAGRRRRAAVRIHHHRSGTNEEPVRGFDAGAWAQAVWLTVTGEVEPSLWFYPDGVHVDANGHIALDLHGRIRWHGDAEDVCVYGAFARRCTDDADRLAVQMRRAIERWAGTVSAPEDRLRCLMRLRELILREVELLRVADRLDFFPSPVGRRCPQGG